MNIQLDERQELTRKIEKLSPPEIQKVRVFISGMEAGRTAIAKDIQNVRIKTDAAYDPWGVIQYTAVERQDFGTKTTVCAMRTDTFEIIYQSEQDDFSIRYDGEQYLILLPN